MNIDQVNITTQEDDKLLEGKTYLDIAVQTMKTPSQDFVTNSTTLAPKVNQEIAHAC